MVQLPHQERPASPPGVNCMQLERFPKFLDQGHTVTHELKRAPPHRWRWTKRVKLLLSATTLHDVRFGMQMPTPRFGPGSQNFEECNMGCKECPCFITKKQAVCLAITCAQSIQPCRYCHCLQCDLFKPVAALVVCAQRMTALLMHTMLSELFWVFCLVLSVGTGA